MTVGRSTVEKRFESGYLPTKETSIHSLRMTILRGGYGICKVNKGSTADFQRCFRKDCFGSPFHFFYAGVAQLAERLLCKQWVGGSRPSTGSTRLITSPVPPNDKKTPYPKGYGAPWQRVKDSNCSASVKCVIRVYQKVSNLNAFRVSL